MKHHRLVWWTTDWFPRPNGRAGGDTGWDLLARRRETRFRPFKAQSETGAARRHFRNVFTSWTESNTRSLRVTAAAPLQFEPLTWLLKTAFWVSFSEFSPSWCEWKDSEFRSSVFVSEFVSNNLKMTCWKTSDFFMKRFLISFVFDKEHKEKIGFKKVKMRVVCGKS